MYTDPGTVAVTDFDGFCLGDPALDVGYFLAYLRPARMWRGDAEARARHATAVALFTAAYARAMTGRGAPADAVAAILSRAPLHEAAALLKIAGRRPHRCNAPRPAELTAMLEEIERCLSSARTVPDHQRRGAS